MTGQVVLQNKTVNSTGPPQRAPYRAYTGDHSSINFHAHKKTLFKEILSSKNGEKTHSVCSCQEFTHTTENILVY